MMRLSALRSLHVRTIVEVPVRLFAPWLAMVFVATLGGYPGVVCLTPLAWLMALAVGRRCAERSSSPAPWRMLEAALAGAFFGLLQGVLYLIIAPRMGPVADHEQPAALAISLGMLCAGVPVAAGLSALIAGLIQRRQDSA